MYLDFQRSARPIAWVAVGWAAIAVGVCPSALAQTSATAGSSAASGASAQNRQAIDRAEGEGDKVFKWILIHADKPRKTGSGREDKSSVASAKPTAAAKVAKTGDASKVALRAVAAEPKTEAPAESPAASSVADAQPVSTAEATPIAAPTDDVVATASAAATTKPPLESAVAEPPAPLVEEAKFETLMPLKRVDPKIPPNLLGKVGSGHVEVHFTVLPDGSVADAAVDVTNNRHLVPYALDAVAQWKFAPLKRSQAGAVDLVFNLD